MSAGAHSPRSAVRAGTLKSDSDDLFFEPSAPASAGGTAPPPDAVERMAAACRVLLEGIGEDPEREGLAKTPMRMAKALLAITAGYALVSGGSARLGALRAPSPRLTPRTPVLPARRTRGR